MFCEKCGARVPDDCTFCTMCGHNIQQSAQPQYSAPVGDTAAPSQDAPVRRQVLEFIMGILDDNLFFAICILLSVTVGLKLLAGAIDVLNGLALIFLWIIYSQGRKNIVDVGKMRCVSGVVYANVVISYVACGLLALSAVLVILMGDIGEEALDLLELEMFGEEIFADFAGIFMAVFGVVMLAIALGIFLFTYFGWSKIHKFVKSLYVSGECDCFTIVNWDSARVWLMVLGILAAVGALSGENFLAIAAGGCEAATMIVGSVLIKRHFSELPNIAA